MILKFIMRDAAGEVVAGTPTVTADGDALTPTDETDYWTVDAPLGSLVTATLTGAVPLDVQMPLVDGTSVNVGAVGGTEVTGPDDLKADVSGVLEAIDAIDFPPPDDGVAITQATLGTDGDPLGRVMPYGRITAYLGTVPHYQFDADADGDYAYTLPAGSAWTLVARRAGYRTMTTEVTT